MAGYKVPCPSCETPVPIKDPKLIGTKVECLKCKYRFKVEEPAGGIPKDDGKADKKQKDAKKKATAESGAKKPKGSKKLLAVIAGVIAVGVLAIAAYSFIGGDGGKPVNKGFASGGNNIPKGGTPKDTTPPEGTDPDGKQGTEDPDNKDKDKEKEKTAAVKPKVVIPFSKREASNLLPGQTVSLYRFDVDTLRQTPANSLFDGVTQELFRASMGVEASNVGVYYHAFVGPTRDPFGVIRLREPIAEQEVLARMQIVHDAAAPNGPKKLNDHLLYTFISNPFASGLGSALSMGSLFADVYTKTPPSPVAVPAARTLGVCIFDSQHILIGDRNRLEAFLKELNDKTGYPAYRSVVGNPVAGMALAENPQYLTIDPKLKKLLKSLGSESSSPPPVLYAEELVTGLYNPKFFKPELKAVAEVLEPVLNRAQFLGANMTSFTAKQFIGTIRVVATSNSAAMELVKDPLTPALKLATTAATEFLEFPIEFRNLTAGGGTFTSGKGTTTFPGGEGTPSGGGFTLGGGGSGRPGYGSGSGTQSPPSSLTPGLGAGSGGGATRPPGFGSQPGPGMGGGTGGFGGRGGDGFDNPSGPVTPLPKPGQVAPSHIDLGLTDQEITLTVEMNWTDEAYRRLIAPRLFGFANTIKGKMAVFTSEQAYFRLSAAVPAMTAATKAFPRGTADRKLTDASRMGLRYPPNTRVSFFAELLPYMGRGSLAAQVNRDVAWFDEKNTIAAQAWVPELLVATYPQSAWRANSPFVPDGQVLGGTNYVAIAGIGVNAARYHPEDAQFAKKMGITGYDWGSKVEEVKDGLAHTIYLIQTPPGLSQPWLAGGGATVRGLDENDPMRGFNHDVGDGKIGTYALMANGSVRFLPANINPKVLLAMSTRAGGEDIAAIIDREAPLVELSKKTDAEVKTEPMPSPMPSSAPDVAPAPREKM